MSDALDYFRGRILIVAPHMDDAIMACGRLIARRPEKAHMHVA